MANNFGGSYLLNNHFNHTIINQYVYPRLHIMREIFKGHASHMFITEDILCCQSVRIPCFNGNRLIIHKASQTNLRAFGIHQCCNRQTKFFPQTGNLLEPLLMSFMIAMGKIKASYIHAREHDLTHNCVIIGSRPDRTYNFCFSHNIHASFSLFHHEICLTLIVYHKIRKMKSYFY